MALREMQHYLSGLNVTLVGEYPSGTMGNWARYVSRMHVTENWTLNEWEDTFSFTTLCGIAGHGSDNEPMSGMPKWGRVSLGKSFKLEEPNWISRNKVHMCTHCVLDIASRYNTETPTV